MTRPASWSGAGDIAATHHAALNRAQAAESGIHADHLARLVARGFLVPAGPNVFTIAGSPTTWRQRVALATLALPGTVASHRCAARLRGVDGASSDVVEVIVGRGQRLRVPDVVVHQVGTAIPAGDILVVDGIPTTSLARTIVDLGSVVSRGELIRACDDFERRGHSTAWLEQVARRLHRPGQRGPRAVLEHLAVRAEQGRVAGSWFERMMDECLRSTVLPPLIAQHVLRDDAGRFVARFDLALPDVRLGIEMHSRSFHMGVHQEVVDQRRENRAMLIGWQLLYLGWADRKTPAEARVYLEQLYLRRRVDLGQPSVGD